MLTQAMKLQLKNEVRRVLSVPGNYQGGILEMALVCDYSLPQKELEEYGKGVAAELKSLGETFRNVRMNLVRWISDKVIMHEISSLALLQTGGAFREYSVKAESDGRPAGKGGVEAGPKRLEELYRQLKIFQARSKLIIMIGSGNYYVKDEEALYQHKRPFLYRKLILIDPAGIRSDRISFTDK